MIGGRMPPDNDKLSKSSSDELPISKWQKASVDITNLKFKLGRILDDFTQEEKESKKYEHLMETVDILFEHVLGPHHEKIEEKIRQEVKQEILKETEETSKNSSFPYKTFVLTVSGAVAYKIIENVFIFLLTL